MRKSKTSPPPDDLSKRSKGLWESVVGSRTYSIGRLTMLEQALRSLVRSDQCRRLIDEQGLVSTTKATGAVHLNPLVKAEREHRQLFGKLWDKLALHFDQEIDGWS